MLERVVDDVVGGPAVVDVVVVPAVVLVLVGVGIIKGPVPVGGTSKVAVRVECVMGAAFETPIHMLYAIDVASPVLDQHKSHFCPNRRTHWLRRDRCSCRTGLLRLYMTLLLPLSYISTSLSVDQGIEVMESSCIS